MKGKIRNFSGQAHLSAQEVLQMYFFERFLDRLSKSEYKENFVIKGGFLIASLIGVQNRTTMDMDTTVKGIPLREETIKEILTSIVEVDVQDDINFRIAGIDYIREDDDYENFRVSLCRHRQNEKSHEIGYYDGRCDYAKSDRIRLSLYV